jgi:hypothetical protein
VSIAVGDALRKALDGISTLFPLNAVVPDAFALALGRSGVSTDFDRTNYFLGNP